MDCLTPKDLLAAWDGLLSEAERKELAAHLAQCPRCAALEKTVGELVRLATAVAPTAPLSAAGSCPTESDLLDYVAQRLAGTGRNQLEAHLAGCRQCLWQVAAMARTELEALPPVSPEWRDAVRQAEALVGEPPQTRRAGWWLAPAWRYGLASAAAAALVLLAVGFFWYAGRDTLPPVPNQAQVPAGEPSPAPPPPRGEEPTLLAQQKPLHQSTPQVRKSPGAAQSSPQVLWPQEGKQVAREELEIRWKAVPGAHLYEVTVLNRSGDVVWEAQAPGDRLRVPDEVELRVGERYFIWVTAHVKGNGTVRSPSVAFEIDASPLR